jgi:hypothetical protein
MSQSTGDVKGLLPTEQRTLALAVMWRFGPADIELWHEACRMFLDELEWSAKLDRIMGVRKARYERRVDSCRTVADIIAAC